RGRQRTGGGARLLLEQPPLVRRVLDVLADAPRARVDGDLFGPEEDTDRVVVGAHDHVLGDEPPRHRIFVSVEDDTKQLRDAGALDLIGIEWSVGQWLEQSFLFVTEDERRHLAGLLVHPSVGKVVAPGGRLGVEVEQVAKAAAGPEATPYEADRSLDASLLVPLPHIAGHHGEATSCAGVG